MKNPPLRMDARNPDFDLELGARVEVLLNGTPLGDVIAYDVKERWILRNATDERGNIVLDLDRCRIQTEKLYGDVAVRWH